MIVSCDRMRQAEEAAFSRGIKAADLMATAGLGLAEIVRQFHPRPGTCVVFCGKGNNAGDALVAAAHLQKWGWRIRVHAVCGVEAFSELPARHFQALNADLFSTTPSGGPLVVLDGLLGLGARGEPRGEIAGGIRAINQLRRENSAWVLAIDLPSGLDGDSGIPSACCVEADLTATIAGVKQGLVADSAINQVGRIAVVPLPALDFSGEGQVSAPSELRTWLPPRRFDLHKGDCGRVGIIAGSPGFLGAARMCSAAAVHAGAGLVTVFARPDLAERLSLICIPEVMVKTVSNYRDVLNENLDVLAVGPGLGQAHATEILSLIREVRQPMVIDADALNMLSRDLTLLQHCRGPRLLTPHPGEMERLTAASGRTRRQWVEDFLARFPVTVLLKGARTLTGSGGQYYYNTTGNPGLASGGMGDVLTGVCAALIPQIEGDKKLLRSAVLGAWLCGRAGEIGAFAPGGSPESLSATTVLACLGGAFRALRQEV
ncbi:MAG: NAD(P)H-hydrate dehydratase [Verrucomicrobiota bacterium]